MSCASLSCATAGTHENANGCGIDALETADVDGLGVVAQPIAKVGPFNQHGCPFAAVQEGEAGEHVLDIYEESDAALFGGGILEYANLHDASCVLQPSRVC